MKKLRIVPILVILLLALAVPAYAKKVSSPGIKISEKKGANDFRYSMWLTPKKTSNLKGAPKLNAKIILPKELCEGKNTFCFNSYIELNKGKKFIGTINQDWVAMKGSGSGKPKIQRMTPYSWINRSNKGLSVKKSGKNYVLTIKDLPYYSTYLPAGEEDPSKVKPLDKKTKYTFNVCFELSVYDNDGGTPNSLTNKVNGWMYVSKASIKAAKKLDMSKKSKISASGGKRLTWKADEEQNWYDVKEKNIKVKWKKVSY